MKIPTILKGDDSGIIELTMAEGRSYEGATLVVAYQGVTRQFTDLVAGQKVNLAFTHDETAGFKLGCKPLLMRLIGPLGAVETVENAEMRIKVTDCLGELNAGGSFLVKPGATAVPVTDVGDVGERYTLADLHAKINTVIHVLAQRSLLSLAVLLAAGAAFGASARLDTLYNDDLVVTNVDDIAAAASTAQQTASAAQAAATNAQQTASAAQTAASNAQQTADEATRSVDALADDVAAVAIAMTNYTDAAIAGANHVPYVMDVNSNYTAVTIGTREKGSIVGKYSFAQGTDVVASGFRSHAEGENTYADTRSSHAEGEGTYAHASFAHAEGGYTIAEGLRSHAEGEETFAGGTGAHAEGHYSQAVGGYSSAKGVASYTEDAYSFVHSGYKPTKYGSLIRWYEGIYAGTNTMMFYRGYIYRVCHKSGYPDVLPERGRTNAWWEAVWDADLGRWATLNRDHGRGTFNIHPVGGLSGFWVGETNMEDHIANAVGAQIGEVAARAVTQPDGSAEPDDYRVQIGHGATATGPAGKDTTSAGRNQSIAIGYNATATNWTSVAIGSGGWSVYTNEFGVETGRVTNAATADGREAVAIGYGAKAHGNMSTAVGKLARAHGDYSAAFGAQSVAGQHGVAIGFGADAATHGMQRAIAIGRYASANAENSVQLFTGTNDVANSIKIGNTFVWRGGHPENENDPHFKTFTNSLFKTDPVRFNTAIGHSAAVVTTEGKTTNTSSVAIGRSARVEPAYGDAQASVAIGMQAKSANISAITIGHSSSNYGKRSIAVGRDVVISNDVDQAYMDAIAIGYQARVYSQQGIAIGKTAVVNGSGAVQIGTGTNSEANSLKFRSTTVVGGDGKIPSASLGMTTLTVGGVTYTVGTATIDGKTVLTLGRQ